MSVTTDVDLNDYRWLVGDEAAAWLDRTAGHGDDLVAAAADLRNELSPQRTHLVLEQCRLRPRGREKFSRWARMFFTSLGLEQASDESVACYKATRFPRGARVCDLCSGIGGDLLALATRGPVIGFEQDCRTAILAEANRRTLADMPHDAATNQAAVVTASVGQPGGAVESALQQCAAWHIDPDRRASGRRTIRVESYEPGLEKIERLLELNPTGAVKLAPAAVPPVAWSQAAELEWISRDRQCRQLVAWFNDLAQAPGFHRATILGKSNGSRTLSGSPGLPIETAAGLGRFVFEPDAAVLAADLSGLLAATHGLQALSPGVAYLTGDVPIADAALGCFEVQEVIPFDLKRLRGALRQRQVGRLEIKKRGVAVDPAQLRRQLQLAGDAWATLIVAPLAGKVVAVLAQRRDAALDDREPGN